MNGCVNRNTGNRYIGWPKISSGRPIVRTVSLLLRFLNNLVNTLASIDCMLSKFNWWLLLFSLLLTFDMFWCSRSDGITLNSLKAELSPNCSLYIFILVCVQVPFLPPSSPLSYHCHGELFSGVCLVWSWEHTLAGDRGAGALHRQLRAGVSGAGAAGRQGRRRLGQWWQRTTGLSLIYMKKGPASFVCTKTNQRITAFFEQLPIVL